PWRSRRLRRRRCSTAMKRNAARSAPRWSHVPARRAKTMAGNKEQGRIVSPTQIRVSYRGSSWVFGDTAGFDPTVPAAGDRAPDGGGLRRRNVGFPLRVFDVLRGTEHILIAHLPAAPSPDRISELVDFIRQAGCVTDHLRAIIVAGPDIELPEPAGITVYR